MIKITAANESLLADREIGAVEEIKYDSFDGKPIDGWIVKPPRFDAGKKYPLLLGIHGGPHAMYGVEFQQEMQTQAARGFETVDLLHPQVHQHPVGAAQVMRLVLGERLRAVRTFVNLRYFANDVAQQMPHGRIIFNNQDFHGTSNQVI